MICKTEHVGHTARNGSASLRDQVDALYLCFLWWVPYNCETYFHPQIHGGSSAQFSVKPYVCTMYVF